MCAEAMKSGPQESWPAEAIETYNVLTRRISELEAELAERKKETTIREFFGQTHPGAVVIDAD